MNDGPDEPSLFAIFRLEMEGQSQALTSGLLALERDPQAAAPLESCMRAAHSLKGACRIVGLSAGVETAHVMEDCFVAAQKGQLTLNRSRIDLMLAGVDLISRIACTPEADASRWQTVTPEIVAFAASVKQSIEEGGGVVSPGPGETAASASWSDDFDRVLRVTPENLNRLLALAGESLVESRRLKPFVESIQRLKRLHGDLDRALNESEETGTGLAEAKRLLLECRQFLAGRLAGLEMFEHRSAQLSHRLYDEALAMRMRPFIDGIPELERTTRDLSRMLGKEARLELIGMTTQVDRDILEKLKAPIAHLLRNALDHGVETPDERRAAGKTPEAVIRVEARHNAGTLQISLSDDGRGIDMKRLRATVIARGLADAETSAKLTEAELFEFLFLPRFTLKEEVTEISGRGVGLDAVRTMVRKAGGSVRVSSRPGEGTRFQLQLPLTLSVIRSLLAEIGGEAYAFPLSRVQRALKLAPDRIDSLEGRLHFDFNGHRVGLVAAHQILGGEATPAEKELSVVVIGDGATAYGLAIDSLLGERELVVQRLDPRLGKVKDIAASALMEDGTPVLILDCDDLIRSVEKLLAGGRLETVRAAGGTESTRCKRILVVDDSLTVRELERKILGNHGYQVEVAVDGMDGWNAVRAGRFDLVVSDIDMPRVDGIELVGLIRRDPELKALPVMIVSYKDREEDRRRGLDAGADYYLAKGNFQEEALLQAVIDLIGEAGT